MAKKQMSITKEQIRQMQEREAAEDARRQAEHERIIAAQNSITGTVENQIQRKQMRIDYYNDVAQVLKKEIEALSQSYARVHVAYKAGYKAHADEMTRVQAAGLPASYQAPQELNVLARTLNSHSDLMKAYRVNIENHEAAASLLEQEIQAIRDREDARLNPPDPIIPAEELELIELRQRVEKLEAKKAGKFFRGKK